MILDQNIEDYNAKYFCIFKNDDFEKAFKQYKDEVKRQQQLHEDAGDYKDTDVFAYEDAIWHGKRCIKAVWKGPECQVQNAIGSKFPDVMKPGTTIFIDPAKAEAGNITSQSIIGTGYDDNVGIDKDLLAGKDLKLGDGGISGGDLAGLGGTSSISMMALLKWVSIGISAALLLHSTYPWWSQKLKYMVQKCLNGRSLAEVEFSIEDGGGDRGNDYRFRYDLKYGKWILEYQKMPWMATKTFPSPKETEQFVQTQFCKKFIRRCAKIIYAVLDDECFESFMDALKGKDKRSYEFCKQLLDSKATIHRTFETSKVKYL